MIEFIEKSATTCLSSLTTNFTHSITAVTYKKYHYFVNKPCDLDSIKEIEFVRILTPCGHWQRWSWLDGTEVRLHRHQVFIFYAYTLKFGYLATAHDIIVLRWSKSTTYSKQDFRGTRFYQANLLFGTCKAFMLLLWRRLCKIMVHFNWYRS